MTLLLLGLLIFLAIHCLSLFKSTRDNVVDKLGLVAFRSIYGLIALAALVLISLGYGEARLQPTWIWHPPVGLRHLSSLITLVAMIFLAAQFVPKNAIKARMGHPLFIAVKAWALAHLVSNGTLADLLLFGSFLVWAVVGFIVLRRQDRAANVQPSESALPFTLASVVLGVLIWAAFAFHLHNVLIGVKPFG